MVNFSFSSNLEPSRNGSKLILCPIIQCSWLMIVLKVSKFKRVSFPWPLDFLFLSRAIFILYTSPKFWKCSKRCFFWHRGGNFVRWILCRLIFFMLGNSFISFEIQICLGVFSLAIGRFLDVFNFISKRLLYLFFLTGKGTFLLNSLFKVREITKISYYFLLNLTWLD